MEHQEHKQLTVTLAGRPYPLKIKVLDEPILRKIIKEVNEKINRFRLAYPNRDMQDCLAMATLAYAVDLHKARHGAPNSTQNDLPDIEKQIAQLETLVDSFLN